MKKIITYSAIALGLSLLLNSCGLVRGLGNTVGRTVQSVGRTVF